MELQKHNSQTLNITLDITLSELINQQEKLITLKRKIDDKFINTDFSFTYNNNILYLVVEEIVILKL